MLSCIVQNQLDAVGSSNSFFFPSFGIDLVLYGAVSRLQSERASRSKVGLAERNPALLLEKRR